MQTFEDMPTRHCSVCSLPAGLVRRGRKNSCCWGDLGLTKVISLPLSPHSVWTDRKAHIKTCNVECDGSNKDVYHETKEEGVTIPAWVYVHWSCFFKNNKRKKVPDKYQGSEMWKNNAEQVSMSNYWGPRIIRTGEMPKQIYENCGNFKCLPFIH